MVGDDHGRRVEAVFDDDQLFFSGRREGGTLVEIDSGRIGFLFFFLLFFLSYFSVLVIDVDVVVVVLLADGRVAYGRRGDALQRAVLEVVDGPVAVAGVHFRHVRLVVERGIAAAVLLLLLVRMLLLLLAVGRLAAAEIRGRETSGRRPLNGSTPVLNRLEFRQRSAGRRADFRQAEALHHLAAPPGRVAASAGRPPHRR